MNMLLQWSESFLGFGKAAQAVFQEFASRSGAKQLRTKIWKETALIRLGRLWLLWDLSF